VIRNRTEEETMQVRQIGALATVLGAGMTWMAAGMADAAEIKVLSSAGTREAYRELVPAFEKASEHKVTTSWAGTADIMKRIQAGETYDLVIMSAQGLEELIRLGKIVAGSRVDIAKSGVGVAVRAGAARPDFGSSEALKRTLLAAKSIGYSTGPSGVYLIKLFQRMGIADEIKQKVKQVPTGIPVGTIIASGEAEIGFQQVSELIRFPGIDYLGPLPAEIQETTVFAAGLHPAATQTEAAKALVKFLTSPAAVPVIKSTGMEPG
jgi:molybdate transport system substrate-binding protein